MRLDFIVVACHKYRATNHFNFFIRYSYLFSMFYYDNNIIWRAGGGVFGHKQKPANS